MLNKALSENSVQIVLSEHSVQAVLNVIRVNREFKSKKDSLLLENAVQTVVAHNINVIQYK